MQKTRLTRLFWLIVLAALLVGCGVMASPPTPSPTQPPPTWTPIPPTETPVPTDTPTSVPTDTATPVPTQSISSLFEALQPAASQGIGVPEAAAYDPNKSGVHPIVIIASYEDFKLWNSYLPVSWRPMNVSQAELVALFLYSEVIVESVRVTRGGAIFKNRIRVDTEIILREALTGKTIATTFFQGGEPPEFPPGHYRGITAYYGTKVAYETVELWLKEFVEK